MVLREGLKTALGADVLTALPETLPARRGKVVVAGAGFAGLATAHFLVRLGYEVVVHEPRSVVGGRVCTDRSFVDGATIEFGAELIGDNHVVWLALADAFGLDMRDVSEGDPDRRPLLLDGRLYLGSDPENGSGPVWKALDKLFALLTEDAKQVTSPYRPWRTPGAAELDAQPLDTRLDALMLEFPEELRERLRTAVEEELSDNNVVRTSEQSLLASLAQISGGGGAEFWTKSETKRCAEGNSALADALAQELTSRSAGRAEVRLNSALRETRRVPDGVELRTTTGEETCDYVVLAMPPTVWNEFEHGEYVSIDMAQIGSEYAMQTGRAVKFFTAVERRFWESDGRDPAGMAARRLIVPGSDPVVFPHAEGETWDGTDNQNVPSGQAELSVFVGGPGADDALDRLASGKHALDEWYRQALEVLYPGYTEHRQATAAKAWPLEPWIRTGYSCPGPGQVTSVGPLLAEPYRERYFFAGEHTCPPFFGYMEGALESGLLAAGLVTGTYEEVADALDAAAKVPVGKTGR